MREESFCFDDNGQPLAVGDRVEFVARTDVARVVRGYGTVERFMGVFVWIKTDAEVPLSPDLRGVTPAGQVKVPWQVEDGKCVARVRHEGVFNGGGFVEEWVRRI